MPPVNRRIVTAVYLVLLVLVGHPVTGADALRLADHPLVGQLWWVPESASGDHRDALQRLADTDVLLLGESHGNPDHHSLQLRVLETMVAAGRRPTVAFEIFDLEDQPVIDRLQGRDGLQADELAEAVDMKARGWDWAGYRALVQFALDQTLPVVATNLSRKQAMDVAQGGLTVLPEDTRTRLGLDRPLPPEIRDRLQQRMVDAHCGHLPAGHADGMIDAQRARDAYMANRLASTQGPVVLITGAGHARMDYGVPHYLSRLAPQRSVLSVAFTEVDSERRSVHEYLEHGSPVYHLLWFTRRASPDDPCEAFRRQLEGMGRE